MPKRKSKKKKEERQETSAPDEKERERRFEEAMKEIDERYAEVFRRLAKN